LRPPKAEREVSPARGAGGLDNEEGDDSESLEAAGGSGEKARLGNARRRRRRQNRRGEDIGGLGWI
jgi:hypothetical protein